MSQTDRQTDKSSNWAVTAFNNDMLLLEDGTSWPSYVKKVYGGRETCPDTGRVHFQGHIQLVTQQRMSALKKWLPTAHLEIARNFKASVTYAMKSDTATGDKNEVVNPRPFIDNQSALMMLARIKNPPDSEADLSDKDFWYRVKVILREQPHLCGLLAKPDIYRMWKHTWEVWIEEATEEAAIKANDEKNLAWCEERYEESIVLQTPTIFSSENINAQEQSDDAFQQNQSGAQSEEGHGDSSCSSGTRSPSGTDSEEGGGSSRSPRSGNKQ